MIQIGHKYQNQRGEDIEIIFFRDNIYYGYNDKTKEVTKHRANGEYIDLDKYKLKVPTEVWLDFYRDAVSQEIEVYLCKSEKELEAVRDDRTIKTLKVDLFI